MRSKLRLKVVPLQLKLSIVFILASLIIFIVNAMLVLGINNLTLDMDSVYRDNLRLNELTMALDNVQNNMTEYLNTKTTDSLELYYKSAQEYSYMISELNTTISDDKYDIMERDIRNMSEDYLLATQNAIEAKRGRNVEKYSAEYDKAGRLYDYINTYITSLNNERFKSNSENFTQLIREFRFFEIVSMAVMLGAIISSSVFVIGFNLYQSYNY